MGGMTEVVNTKQIYKESFEPTQKNISIECGKKMQEFVNKFKCFKCGMDVEIK